MHFKNPFLSAAFAVLFFAYQLLMEKILAQKRANKSPFEYCALNGVI